MQKTLLASAVLLAFSQLAIADTVGHQATDGVYGEKINIEESVNYGIKVNGVNSSLEGESIVVKDAVRGLQISTGDDNGNASLNLGKKGVTKLVELHAKSSGFSLGFTNMGPADDGLKQGIKGATVNVNTDKLVVTSTATGSGWAYGIHVANNSTEAGDQLDTRATTNILAKDIFVDVNSETDGHANALVAMSEGILNVNGNLYVNTQGGKGNAIVARGNAIVNINSSNSNTVVLNGNISFDYDKATSNTPVNATVNVNLSGKNSSWTGNTVVAWSDPAEDPDKTLAVSNMTLNLSDGATWTPVVTKQDATTVKDGEKYVALNNLKLNNGVVNVTDEKIDVTVENLEGSGTVNLAVAKSGEELTAGSITVQNEKNAKLNVQFANITSDNVNAEEAAKLMNDAVSGVKNTMGSVAEGMYNGAFTFDNQGTVTSQSTNTLMQSSLELASAAPLAINRILMNDVRKRLGDIRTSEGTSGAWARYDGGRLAGSNGLENDFHTIQVGMDTQPTQDPLRFGVAFSYTTSDTDYARGSADMDAYSIAGYGVWLGENGQFVDVVARMATAKTDMTVDGNKKGEMDNVALSLSGEFGWRFDVANNFYVEPQIEGTYTYVDADNLELSDGSTYKYDAVDSFLGRAGVAFGVKCPDNKGNVYARVSAVHEFLGDAAVTGGNGTVYKLDGKDTWVEYGLGANFNITSSTYVWADVERTSGGVLDEDYRATLGVRYAW